jgi:hypothetical protein
LFAQDMSYSKAGKNIYLELPNQEKTPVEEWAKVTNDIQVSFVSSNISYPKSQPPVITKNTTLHTIAWKGEKVNTQLLLWTKPDIAALSLSAFDLSDNIGNRIKAENIKTGFVRYVITDKYQGGCDQKLSMKVDSSLVADPIDIVVSIPVSAYTVQPVWVSIKIPGETPPGDYSGIIIVNTSKKDTLNISIKVVNQTLPPSGEWNFDLDLWQHPAAIARVHQVPLWSDRHFSLMRPYYELLASAGQKSITATLINEPWGHQTYDDFPALIKWTKRKDNSWSYDYFLFDKYVSFVMNCGITKRINCYTLVPWKLDFQYFDEALGKDTVFHSTVGSEEYNRFWTTMLTDFTRHLKEKGWFDISTIAMDERPMDAMKSVISLLKKVDPQWKIALAGDEFQSEIEGDIYDYSIAISKSGIDESIISKRQIQGKPITFYTCCADEYPNNFTFSPPAENAAAKGFSGFLKWAYNSWPMNPLMDSRFTRFPAGDTYLVYPGPRSCVRFEKLIEGIQDFEKIGILRNQFIKKGDTNKLKELNEILDLIKKENLANTPADEIIDQVKTRMMNIY